MFASLSPLEWPVLLWFQEVLRNPVTDPIISVFTHLGDSGILFIVLTALLLCFPKTRQAGFAAACALVFSLLFTNVILKNIFQRPRPWVDCAALIPLVAEHDPNSFPSGHTSAAFAFAFGSLRALPKRWMKVSVVVLAALMALSRLYVGVHYPSDVLAGFVVGDLAGLCGWLLSGRLTALAKARSS